MSETMARGSGSCARVLATVILGTLVFFVIVGLVSKGVGRLFQGQVAESVRARATLAISGAALGEIVVLVLLVGYLRRRSRSLGDLGWWQGAPAAGWLLAALFTALYLGMTLTAVLRGRVGWTEFTPFRLYNALVAGIVAGTVEEIFFRGFVMSELRWSGFGATIQIIAGGLLFGVAHSGWGFFSGHVNWGALIGTVIATSVLGLFYAITYVVSRRSLMPSIAGHVLMDFLIEPWLVLSALAGTMARVH